MADSILSSTSSYITYNGAGWATNQADNSAHNEYTFSSTTSTGDNAVILHPTYEFTDAVIYGYAGKDAGEANIYVDNVLVDTVDCYLYLDASNAMKNAAIYWVKGLPKGTHSVKVECKGTKNASSTGYKVGVNNIILLNPDKRAGEQENNTVMFVGDSICDSKQAYCDGIIKSMLYNVFPNNKLIFKYAMRPGTSTDYVKFLENDIIGQRPKFISFKLGTNDLGTTLNTSGNLKNIVDMCQKYNVDLQFCTIPPRNGISAGLYIAINNTIIELCSKNNLPMVHLNKIVFNNTPVTTTPMQADGVHPDGIGHYLMAKALFDSLISPRNPFIKLLRS